MKLRDKNIIVTGANRGIGKAMVELFATEGARVILVGRQFSQLEEVKNTLPKNFSDTTVDHTCLEMDVSTLDSIKQGVAAIAALKLPIDSLVNNAGIMIDAPLMMTKSEDLDRLFNVNTLGVIYVTQSIVKLMIRNKKGSIINLTSIIGTNGAKGQSVYSATKSAVIGFTKSLSKELATLDIRVNAISPGFIETDMTSGKTEQFYEANLANIAMKRFGKPEEVAELAAFLASDKSNYITGQVIGIDGGMII